MAEPIFWRCDTCGNLYYTLHDAGVTPMCCGKKMTQLVANSTDAAQEKHVPAISNDGDKITVQVGSVEHPMDPDHFIEWIALVNDGKVVIKYLKPGEKPVTQFCAKCAEGGTVYAYCNKHGLWKAEV